MPSWLDHVTSDALAIGPLGKVWGVIKYFARGGRVVLYTIHALTDVLGRPPRDRLLAGDALIRLLRSPANTPLELSARCRGRALPLEVTWTPLNRAGARHYLLLLRRLGDPPQAEQRLRFLAHFDPGEDAPRN